MLAWFVPAVVGGGDAITQRTLIGAEMLRWLPLVFLLRLGLGAISYAAGTPGGLFAPMLAPASILTVTTVLSFGVPADRLCLRGNGLYAASLAVIATCLFLILS